MATALLTVVTLAAVPQTSYAQFSKKQQKTLQKELDNEYKKKIKQYKQEGWKLSGSSRTIEVALLEHYKQKASDQNKEFSGEVSQCQSINVCKQFALSNAQNRYAVLAGGNVKGHMASLVRADADNPEIEVDKFIAAYENNVKKAMGGVLTESFSLVKDNGTSKEYVTFFILNEEKAVLARKKAMEQSLIETKLTLIEAEEISKFVEEGFDLDE
jgi:hypothetical protein